MAKKDKKRGVQKEVWKKENIILLILFIIMLIIYILNSGAGYDSYPGRGFDKMKEQRK